MICIPEQTDVHPVGIFFRFSFLLFVSDQQKTIHGSISIKKIQICESVSEDRPPIFLPDKEQPKIRPPEGFLSQFH